MNNINIQEYAIEMINGNNESKKNLINYYTKYIFNLVETKYSNTEYDKELLIDAGINGLMKSINEYYINDNNYFSNIARNSIYNSILREISKQNNTAKIIQDLANKMINGDEIAKNKLINYYINYIVQFVKNNFNENIYNQEDLTQTGVVFVLDAINNYKDNNKIYFSTHICKYIKRKYILELKNMKKYSNIEHVGLNNNYLNQHSTDNNLENVENKILIEKAIKNLSKRNLEILYLYIWQNYTLDELAKLYNISKTRIQQIIKENENIMKNNILNIKKKRKKYTKRIK